MTFDKIYQYNFPTTIRFGVGAVNELPAYLKQNNFYCPLIVSDPNVAQLSFFKKIIDELQHQNISLQVFNEIHKNPVKSDVYKVTDVWDNTERDCIIGSGRGAALDVAR